MEYQNQDQLFRTPKQTRKEPEINQHNDVICLDTPCPPALHSSTSSSSSLSNARSIPIIDLCSPTSEDDAAPVNRRGHRVTICPQSLCMSPKYCKRVLKTESGTAVLDGLLEALPPVSEGDGFVPNLICAVCMETVINRQPTSTSCGHLFCQKCILLAIRMTHRCPLCNCKLMRTQVHRLYF